MNRHSRWLRAVAYGDDAEGCLGAADEIDSLQSRLDSVCQELHDVTAARYEAQRRLDASEKENAFSRKWIRELRERIEGLMSGDPPAESADGIRLIALADVCEAYEKGVVERRVPIGGCQRNALCIIADGHDGDCETLL